MPLASYRTESLIYFFPVLWLNTTPPSPKTTLAHQEFSHAPNSRLQDCAVLWLFISKPNWKKDCLFCFSGLKPTSVNVLLCCGACPFLLLLFCITNHNWGVFGVILYLRESHNLIWMMLMLKGDRFTFPLMSVLNKVVDNSYYFCFLSLYLMMDQKWIAFTREKKIWYVFLMSHVLMYKCVLHHCNCSKCCKNARVRFSQFNRWFVIEEV